MRLPRPVVIAEYGYDCSPEGRIVIAGLYKMTFDEIFAIAVDAGIYTPDGQLTANYRDNAEPSICRPTN